MEGLTPELLTSDASEASTQLGTIENDVATGDGGHNCGVVFAFVLSFLLGGLVLLFGLVGNSLAIVILHKEKTATGFLLLSLAVADMTILLTLFLMKGVPAFCSFAKVYSFFDIYWYLLIYGWPMASVTHSAGCWITVLVTAHRYVSVCHPYKSPSVGSLKKVRIYVLVAVLFSIFFNLPTFLDNYLVEKRGVNNETYLDRVYTALGENKTYTLVYKTILFYLLMYVIPLGLLIFMTIRLMINLKEAGKRRAQMTNKEVSNRETTIMLVAVVIVFVCCQSLVPFRRVLEAALDRTYQACPYFYFYYAEINVWLVMLNSASNFVIYCIFGRRFRESLVKLFKRCCQGNKVSPASASNMFPTASVNTVGSGAGSGAGSAIVPD